MGFIAIFSKYTRPERGKPFKKALTAFFVGFVIFVFSNLPSFVPVAQAAEPPAIFFLHGFHGTRGSLGDLPKILKQELGAEVFVLSFTTEDPKLTTRDFARQIYARILSTFVNRGWRAERPYSIIAHSLGGVVALRYMTECFAPVAPGKPAPCSYAEAVKIGALKNSLLAPDFDTRYAEKLVFEHTHGAPKNIRFFVPLGTPFWGSSRASGLQTSVIRHVVPKLDDAQLAGMAFGSLNAINMRRYLISTRGALPEGMKVYPFAGDMSESETTMLGSIIRGPFRGTELENDVCVNVENAQMNFHYMIERDPALPGPQGAERTSGTVNLMHGFFPVKAAHFPLPGFPGLASPFLTDGTRENFYGNPTLPALLELFRADLDNRAPSMDADAVRQAFAKNLDNFSVEVRIRLPHGYQRIPKIDEKKISVRPGEGVDESTFARLILPDSFVHDVHGLQKFKEPNKARPFQTFFHAGRLNPKQGISPELYSLNWNQAGAKKYALRYAVQAPGWMTKFFTLEVSPAFSTYAEVYLRPYHPFLPIGAVTVAMSSKGEKDGRVLEDGRVLIAARPDGPAPSGAAGEEKIVVYLGKASKDDLSVEKTSLPRKELTNALKSLNPADARLMPRKCAVAVAGDVITGASGSPIGVHTNGVFKNFGDDAPDFSVQPGERVEVIGRFNKGYVATDYHGERDRYLVTSPAIAERLGAHGDRFAWVNVIDFDVMFGEKCSFDWAK